jgi:hypothetical protein
MTIQEKMLLFAKEHPNHFLDSSLGCPSIALPCSGCPYSWGGSSELCPLDDEIPYVKDIKLSTLKDHPELFI